MQFEIIYNNYNNGAIVIFCFDVYLTAVYNLKQFIITVCLSISKTFIPGPLSSIILEK